MPEHLDPGHVNNDLGRIKGIIQGRSYSPPSERNLRKAEMIKIAVDAHVHLKSPDLSVLRLASANLSAATNPAPDLGVLMLTESTGSYQFEALHGLALARGAVDLAIADDISLVLHDPSRLTLIVIAGRQIVTVEGLELLALGTRRALHDGLPIDDVLAWCADQGALAVLPWGVGKWIGKRGRIVAEKIAASASHTLALGDNGGRPAFWRVTAFDTARGLGIKVLPGSDPLPLRGSSVGIGSTGFSMAFDIDLQTPGHSIINALREPAVAVTAFGSARPLRRFLTDQIAMRFSSQTRRT